MRMPRRRDAHRGTGSSAPALAPQRARAPKLHRPVQKSCRRWVSSRSAHLCVPAHGLGQGGDPATLTLLKPASPRAREPEAMDCNGRPDWWTRQSRFRRHKLKTVQCNGGSWVLGGLCRPGLGGCWQLRVCGLADCR
jgi:hypothetical protein